MTTTKPGCFVCGKPTSAGIFVRAQDPSDDRWKAMPVCGRCYGGAMTDTIAGQFLCPKGGDAMTETFKPNEVFSEGTLRADELIPRFFKAYQRVASKEADEFARGADDYQKLALRGELGDTSTWWSTEEPEWLIEDLLFCLDGFVPAGFNVSAHPGDGACFGVWRNDDDVIEGAEQ